MLTVVTSRAGAPLAALLGAGAVSLLGNVVAAVAIPWFVLATTGSAAKTGIVAFFTLGPVALGAFFGGAVADAIGPKRASVAADVLSGVAIAGIPLLHALGLLELWHLVVLGFLGGVFDAPGEAARQALVPELARRASLRLERANSLYTSLEHAAYVVGAPLAGVLIAAVGAPAALWANAGSFAFSAVAIAVAVPPPGRRGARTRTYLADVADGLRFVWGDRVILSFLVLPALGNLVISPLAPILLPVYAREVFESPAHLGVMIGAYGVGGLAGTASFGVVGARAPRRWLYAGSWLGYGLVGFALVATPPLAVALPTLFLVGLAAGALGPLENTIRHERTPPDLQGRVFATVKAAFAVTVPPGVLAAGFVVEAVGLRAALAVFAGANAVLALVAVSIRAGRRLEERRAASSRRST